jgi:hypothetical protein
VDPRLRQRGRRLTPTARPLGLAICL